jgi:hypothetical protein
MADAEHPGWSDDDRRTRERQRMRTGDGYVCEVMEGESVVFSLPAGPQVMDLNVFHAGNMREHFGSSVTRGRFGIHATSGDALHSCLPWARPMLLIVNDSVRDGGELPEPARRARSWTASWQCRHVLASRVASSPLDSSWPSSTDNQRRQALSYATSYLARSAWCE